MSIASKFRENLREKRAALGMTQTALAARSGYSLKYIARVERGSRQNPTLAFVEVMAGALGCTPEEMLR